METEYLVLRSVSGFLLCPGLVGVASSHGHVHWSPWPGSDQPRVHSSPFGLLCLRTDTVPASIFTRKAKTHSAAE